MRCLSGFSWSKWVLLFFLIKLVINLLHVLRYMFCDSVLMCCDFNYLKPAFKAFRSDWKDCIQIKFLVLFVKLAYFSGHLHHSKALCWLEFSAMWNLRIKISLGVKCVFVNWLWTCFMTGTKGKGNELKFKICSSWKLWKFALNFSGMDVWRHIANSNLFTRGACVQVIYAIHLARGFVRWLSHP